MSRRKVDGRDRQREQTTENKPTRDTSTDSGSYSHVNFTLKKPTG